MQVRTKMFQNSFSQKCIYVIANQFDFLLCMEDKIRYLAEWTSFLYFPYNENQKWWCNSFPSEMITKKMARNSLN